MNRAALHRFPSQTVDSLQIFERWLLQNQPIIIAWMTKSWDKKTVRFLEEDWPNQDHDFLSWLSSSNIDLAIWMLFIWSVISLIRSTTQKRASKKVASFWKICMRRYWQKIWHYKDYNFKSCSVLYQAVLPCTPHSELCVCVWMCTSSKFKFLHLLYGQ